MKTRHSIQNLLVRKVTAPHLFTKKEREFYIQDYVRTHGTFMFHDAVNIFDIEIDITPVRKEDEGKSIYLHLYGTKGEYFRREFYVFRAYDIMSFTFYPIESDKFSCDNVKIEKYGFSCDKGEIVMSFNGKELEQENKAMFL